MDGNGRWTGPTALVCQVSYALGPALCALYLVQLITGLTLVLCVYVPHGAVAYAYVHGQDMVYSRRLVLVHRSVASYMMLLVMLHIYRNVWDNNAPRIPTPVRKH